MKSVFKKLINFFFKKIFNNRFGLRIYDLTKLESQKFIRLIKHNEIEIKFSTPSYKTFLRAKTFTKKEPETIDWINSFEENSIFWDIGANIGMFSLYAAIKKNANVFSFEPSVFNLETLTKNIQINNLSDQITLIPNPISDKSGPNMMKYSNLEVGGALSVFKENFGYDGLPIDYCYKYSVTGITLDEAHETLSIPLPKYIKIDVDGLEHLILKGSKKVLQNIESILIETNKNFLSQYEEITRILKENKFTLRYSALRDDLIINSNNQGFSKVHNQIWEKL
ncbi:FkbM family methyltransferase [Prochlorococcus sp. AH-736-K09]|nr:FkbM family methyltransferase [Prochlorococcus sp. AH-736-K09]